VLINRTFGLAMNALTGMDLKPLTENTLELSWNTVLLERAPADTPKNPCASCRATSHCQAQRPLHSHRRAHSLHYDDPFPRGLDHTKEGKVEATAGSPVPCERTHDALRCSTIVR
jgi:hypothetical protein